MKQENNFEVKNINLEELNEIVEIKDEELKTVTGGSCHTNIKGSRDPDCRECRLF